MQYSAKIIEPKTFALLGKLMGDARLRHFTLVGGTALALQYQHRLSIDLDLFTPATFDSNKLEAYLLEDYRFVTRDKFNNGLMGYCDAIKVDFIRHNYPIVRPTIEVDGLRMAHPLDIAAMKLNAISGNGTRVKDYYDMYVLLGEFSLVEMLAAYEAKYPQSGAIIATKSLTYFDDINFEREPALMIEPINFSEVKARLRAAVLDKRRVFP